jgi:hypothetical protein
MRLSARTGAGTADLHDRRRDLAGVHQLRPYGPLRSKLRAGGARAGNDALTKTVGATGGRGQRGGGHGQW